MSKAFSELLIEYQQRIDAALPSLLGSPDTEFAKAPSQLLNRLYDAMGYSLLNGGKRVRPLLVYAAAQAVNRAFANDAQLDRVAAAVECIHAYSLVHDDLPAMDDDDLRRGQATCHIAFDEATAILAGDALQSRAYELLTDIPDLPANRQLAMVRCLAAAAGPRGMVGGQAIDLESVDQQPQLNTLEVMHQLKTGALLRASTRLGALYAGAVNEQLEQLDRYGLAIGLAFQVQDDILDVESSTEMLGKAQGADQARNKPTYPALMGIDAAREYAQSLYSQAISALEPFDEGADALRELAAFIVKRQH